MSDRDLLLIERARRDRRHTERQTLMRARLVVAEHWNASHSALRARIRELYPQLEPAEADRLLALALDLQRTDRPHVATPPPNFSDQERTSMPLSTSAAGTKTGPAPAATSAAPPAAVLEPPSEARGPWASFGPHELQVLRIVGVPDTQIQYAVWLADLLNARAEGAA